MPILFATAIDSSVVNFLVCVGAIFKLSDSSVSVKVFKALTAVGFNFNCSNALAVSSKNIPFKYGNTIFKLSSNLDSPQPITVDNLFVIIFAKSFVMIGCSFPNIRIVFIPLTN